MKLMSPCPKVVGQISKNTTPFQDNPQHSISPATTRKGMTTLVPEQGVTSCPMSETVPLHQLAIRMANLQTNLKHRMNRARTGSEQTHAPGRTR